MPKFVKQNCTALKCTYKILPYSSDKKKNIYKIIKKF